MTNRPKPEQDAKTGRFLSGNCGGGRPKGSRNKLGEAFLAELCADFEEHGAAVIETVRTERPHDYLRIIAQMLPRELNIETNPFDGLSDAELVSRIRELNGLISEHLDMASEPEPEAQKNGTDSAADDDDGVTRH